MPDPQPVKGRKTDEVQYERAVRGSVLVPMFNAFSIGLSAADAAAVLFEILVTIKPDKEFAAVGINEQVGKQARRVQGHHTAKTVSTFQNALGLDIRPILDDAPVEQWMHLWRTTNVSLIKTIPQQAHERLTNRMHEVFTKRPFDQQVMHKVLRDEFKSTGYNLRRITRDQTNKAVGNLTHIRHQQIGIKEYIWETVRDERVRTSHARLGGTRQRWDRPPGEGHPGFAIQCRCAAKPVLSSIGDAPTQQPPAINDPVAPRDIPRATPSKPMPPPSALAEAAADAPPTPPEVINVGEDAPTYFARDTGGAKAPEWDPSYREGSVFKRPPSLTAWDAAEIYPSEVRANKIRTVNEWWLSGHSHAPQAPRGRAGTRSWKSFSSDGKKDVQQNQLYDSEQRAIWGREINAATQTHLSEKGAQALVNDIAWSAGLDNPPKVAFAEKFSLSDLKRVFNENGFYPNNFEGQYRSLVKGNVQAFQDASANMLIFFVEEGSPVWIADASVVLHETAHAIVGGVKTKLDDLHRLGDKTHDYSKLWDEVKNHPRGACEGHGTYFAEVAADIYRIWGGKNQDEMMWSFKQYKVQSAAVARKATNINKPASLGEYEIASPARRVRLRADDGSSLQTPLDLDATATYKFEVVEGKGFDAVGSPGNPLLDVEGLHLPVPKGKAKSLVDELYQYKAIQDYKKQHFTLEDMSGSFALKLPVRTISAIDKAGVPNIEKRLARKKPPVFFGDLTEGEAFKRWEYLRVRRIQGYDYDQISEATGIHVGHVQKIASTSEFNSSSFLRGKVDHRVQRVGADAVDAGLVDIPGEGFGFVGAPQKPHDYARKVQVIPSRPVQHGVDIIEDVYLYRWVRNRHLHRGEGIADIADDLGIDYFLVEKIYDAGEPSIDRYFRKKPKLFGKLDNEESLRRWQYIQGKSLQGYSDAQISRALGMEIADVKEFTALLRARDDIYHLDPKPLQGRGTATAPPKPKPAPEPVPKPEPPPPKPKPPEPIPEPKPPEPEPPDHVGIKFKGKLTPAERDRRDQYFLEQHQAGRTLADIAREADLSVTRVRSIIRAREKLTAPVTPTPKPPEPPKPKPPKPDPPEPKPEPPVPDDPAPKGPISKEDRNKLMVQLRQQGMSYKAIGDQLGLSVTYVRKTIIKLGGATGKYSKAEPLRRKRTGASAKKGQAAKPKQKAPTAKPKPAPEPKPKPSPQSDTVFTANGKIKTKTLDELIKPDELRRQEDHIALSGFMEDKGIGKNSPEFEAVKDWSGGLWYELGGNISKLDVSKLSGDVAKRYRNLVKALDKEIADDVGPLYRGLHVPGIEYRLGDAIPIDAPTSTSRSAHRSTFWAAGLGESETLSDTLLVVKDGKGAKGRIYNRNEMEVLLAPGQEFVVTNIARDVHAGGFRIRQVVEVEIRDRKG